MKLQDQAITLSQAKRLKELGVTQESLFSWVKHKQTAFPEPMVFYCGDIQAHKEEFGEGCFGIIVVASAFTLSELAAMIGKGTNAASLLYDAVQARMNQGHSFTIVLSVQFVANCVVGMLETGRLTAEEVNARLCHE